MSASPDVKPCEHCGQLCDDADTPGEPCWGQVEIVDETVYDDGDSMLHHACEGHAALEAGSIFRKYAPPP